MLQVFHHVLVVTYLAAPLAAVALDIVRTRRSGKSFPSAGLWMALLCSVVLGLGLVAVYSVGARGRIAVSQVALASYLACGLLMILKSLDWVMKFAVERMVRAMRTRGWGVWSRATIAMLGTTVRAGLLFAIGMPFVMAAVMVYRPKVAPLDDPQSQLGFAYVPVDFTSIDGTRLSGWWIPSISQSASTVIVCHGLASSKSNQLILSRSLVPDGYNVLIFDFRAHGESGGQLTTFGDRERFDVLGAVRWVRSNRPAQSRQIFGLGASMGGAALISAASDASEEGRAIQAIAVYGTFDDLSLEMDSVTEDRFVPALCWLIRKLGLPLASVHCGSDLTQFAPARDLDRLWPRPILVIHGMDDRVIPFERGQRLYQMSSQPRQRIWVPRAGHNEVIDDEPTAQRVREFFDNAKPVPII